MHIYQETLRLLTENLSSDKPSLYSDTLVRKIRPIWLRSARNCISWYLLNIFLSMNVIQFEEMRGSLVKKIEQNNAEGDWKILEELILLDSQAPGVNLNKIIELKGTNDFFGNILPLMIRMDQHCYYESIFRERRQPKARKSVRRRGYNDKGSLRDDFQVEPPQKSSDKYTVGPLPELKPIWYQSVYPGRENKIPLAIASLPASLQEEERRLRKQSHNRIQRKKRKLRLNSESLRIDDAQLRQLIGKIFSQEKELLDQKLLELYAQAIQDRQLLFPEE